MYSTANPGKGSITHTATRSRQERRAERLLIRLAAATLFFVLLFTGLTLMTSHANSELPAQPTAEEQVIIVGSGDTLWEIASDIRKEGEDIRQIVYALQKRNNLSGGSLKAGQSLIVPAD